MSTWNAQFDAGREAAESAIARVTADPDYADDLAGWLALVLADTLDSQPSDAGREGVFQGLAGAIVA